MGKHTQQVTREIWDALGASIFQGSILERIEAVLIKDLNSLEQELLNLGGPNPSGVASDKRSTYMQGYSDAMKAALALVQERKT
jgi:hypothetical protein